MAARLADSLLNRVRSYRGAVVLARQYATAVNTGTDLNRFAPYDRLGIQRPVSSRAERQANAALMALIDHSEDINVPYEATASDDPTPPEGASPTSEHSD